MILLANEFTKLMVVGGYSAPGKVEIIDFSGQNLTCPNINDFNFDYGSVGTYINGKSLVCGGYTFSSAVYHSNCFYYNITVSNCILCLYKMPVKLNGYVTQRELYGSTVQKLRHFIAN